jgi:hypothetical protein
LQRLLVAERLARMNDVSRAVTIIHPDNAASMRSYQSERFVTAAQFVRYQWRDRTWNRCKTIQGIVTTTRFSLSSEGDLIAAGKPPIS